MCWTMLKLADEVFARAQITTREHRMKEDVHYNHFVVH